MMLKSVDTDALTPMDHVVAQESYKTHESKIVFLDRRRREPRAFLAVSLPKIAREP